MEKKAYQFYEMMWYTPPYQKEFFGYFAKKRELLGGEPRVLSRARPSDSLVVAQQECARWWWVWRWIPFVEQVCISGALSFNTDPYETNNPRISLWVVTSPARMWSAYTLMRYVFGCINILQSRKWRPKFDITAVMSEDQLWCLELKHPEYDALLVYQLAHLSLWYQRFDDVSWDIYSSNEWILEYLPNFPMQYVIWLWLAPVSGKTSFTLSVQQFLWYWRWWLLERVHKGISLWIHVLTIKITQKKHYVSQTLIRKDELQKDVQTLKRKLLRKTSSP